MAYGAWIGGGGGLNIHQKEAREESMVKYANRNHAIPASIILTTPPLQAERLQ